MRSQNAHNTRDTYTGKPVKVQYSKIQAFYVLQTPSKTFLLLVLLAHRTLNISQYEFL